LAKKETTRDHCLREQRVDSAAILAETHPTALAIKDVMDAETRGKKEEGYVQMEAQWMSAGARCGRTALLTTQRAENACQQDAGGSKRREKAAHFLLEIWRTENANARMAEKIR
jgi:hypothetical protein